MLVARLVLALALFSVACGEETVVAPHETADPVEYLDEALDIIETRALNRDEVTWDSARTVAHQLAHDADTPAGTYDAITFALRQLGDNHSFLVPASQAGALEGTSTVDESQLPHGEILEERVGYIWLPGLLGAGVQATAYARAAQDIIESFDGEHRPCGWIVDLRDNDGGNMWPMLVGIGPLLNAAGSDEVGRFIDADGEAVSWFYDDGVARVGDEVVTELDADAYVLQDPDVHIAVLTGLRTASSGEAIAVAFRGRPNTRSFGMSTFGVSTGNTAHPLSDGAMLVLTEVRFADRAGEIYGDRLAPDEPTSPSTGARVAAQTWLAEAADC